jgi:6-phosphogluconolactonase
MLVTGTAKSEAVGRALGGAAAEDVPAAGVRGAVQTLWILDRAAAGQIPSD